MEGLSSPKPLLEQKIPTLASVCHCCGKQAYCFLAPLSATSFTLLSFLSSVLWPHCSFLYISLCFHLLLLLLVKRSSSDWGFLLYSLGNICILSVPFPGAFLNASTGASQPAGGQETSLSSAEQEVDSSRLGAWLDSAEHLPLDVLSGCCHAPHTMAQFLSLWWGWQGGLAQKVQTNLASSTTAFFTLLKNTGFLLTCLEGILDIYGVMQCSISLASLSEPFQEVVADWQLSVTGCALSVFCLGRLNCLIQLSGM